MVHYQRSSQHIPKKQKVDKLKVKGKTITDPKNIANEFNNFFADVGEKISNTTHPTKTSPESYLQNQNHDVPDLTLEQTSPETIVNILKLLKPKSSLDIDGISMKLLKSLSNEISIPLSHLFNLSLSQGAFPLALKSSQVTPIFKSRCSET